jgi:hypothetical protein
MAKVVEHHPWKHRSSSNSSTVKTTTKNLIVKSLHTYCLESQVTDRYSWKPDLLESPREKGQVKEDLCKSNLAFHGPDHVLNQCWDKHKRNPKQIFSQNPESGVCIQGWKWYWNNKKKKHLVCIFLAWH